MSASRARIVGGIGAPCRRQFPDIWTSKCYIDFLSSWCGVWEDKHLRAPTEVTIKEDQRRLAVT